MTLKELMTLERILLEIDLNYKFELSFNEAYRLYEYLKQVGKITSYAFLIQDEFNQKYGDVEKLKEYHDKIMTDEIDFNCKYIVEFIDLVAAKLNDDKINELIGNVKFW